MNAAISTIMSWGFEKILIKYPVYIRDSINESLLVLIAVIMIAFVTIFCLMVLYDENV